MVRNIGKDGNEIDIEKVIISSEQFPAAVRIAQKYEKEE